MLSHLIASLSLLASVNAAAVTYAVPASPPTGAAKLSPAPVGISFEFFTFPSYFTNVSATNQCLQNFQTLTGTWPPIRIGGTTQDRATYDAASSAYVSYTVASSTDAPAVLTFGPAFMTLAATYKGTVVLGLDRGKNDLANTLAAAKVAKAKMANLLAIELGNEPEYWLGVQPIATDPWTPAAEAASQNNWDIWVGSGLGSTNIFQAGNSLISPPTWGAAELIASGNATVYLYVHNYAHHSYPGGSVTSLMSHANVVSNMKQFDADVAAATKIGKEYVLGELNSVSGGGAASVSPTYGAAIWTLDYNLRAALTNIQRSYYHHGTLGACQYCWWGRYSMGAPYYGAYAATAAMAHGSAIAALDAGTTTYGGYVIYDSASKPLRVVLINSDYYDGSGTRTTSTYTLTGLTAATVKAKRMTAATALSRVDQGSSPTFGGQKFTDGTCVVTGTEAYESKTVSGGSATFTLAASEALVVYLQ